MSPNEKEQEWVEHPFNLNGGPAFPSQQQGEDNSTLHFKGLSTRDYFAAAAMTGILAGRIHPIPDPERQDETHMTPKQLRARYAYELADAMLAESERSQ